MKLEMTPYFASSPGLRLELGTQFRQLLRGTVEEMILEGLRVPGIRANTLEIWLDVQTGSDLPVCKPMNKGQGKYWSFSVLLPYGQVTNEQGTELSALTRHFLLALKQIIPSQLYDEAVFAACEERILAELAHGDYEEQIPHADRKWLNKLAQKQAGKAG